MKSDPFDPEIGVIQVVDPARGRLKRNAVAALARSRSCLRIVYCTQHRNLYTIALTKDDTLVLAV